MSNTCKTIVDVSDEWCEFLSKDEATIIIYELEVTIARKVLPYERLFFYSKKSYCTV